MATCSPLWLPCPPLTHALLPLVVGTWISASATSKWGLACGTRVQARLQRMQHVNSTPPRQYDSQIRVPTVYLLNTITLPFDTCLARTSHSSRHVCCACLQTSKACTLGRFPRPLCPPSSTALSNCPALRLAVQPVRSHPHCGRKRRARAARRPAGCGAVQPGPPAGRRVGLYG